MRTGNPSAPILAATCLAVCAHPAPTSKAAEPEGITVRLERHFEIREPAWKGVVPASGSPSYEEALSAARALLERHPAGEPTRLATAAPCILRVVRANDVAAGEAKPTTLGLVYQSTWIDLRQVTGVAAGALGRESNETSRTFLPTAGDTTTFGGLVGTCAFFRGAPGFARWTEVFTLPGQTDPVHRAELEDEPGPRICVANDIEPDQLAEPLRRLATLCGGRPADVSLDDVPESPNPRKGIEAMGRALLARDVAPLERAVARDPSDVEAWAKLGKANHEYGRLEEAAAAYAKALALRPGDPAVLDDRGVLYRAMGRGSEALESFRLAIEADPSRLEPRFHVGLVHAYDLLQPEKAASAWAEVFRLDPRSELGLRARWEIGKLGSLHAHGEGVRQDWAKARALFETSCELGETLACQSLAAIYANGHGVPKDAAKVEALRKKACGLGDERACGAGR